MIGAMDLSQVVYGDMCVDLRRHDTGVPEKLLDGPQVGAARQHMGRE
jgi:hypothetical protein